MGTAIVGPNGCMGLGYGHFFKLRLRIAELADLELARLYSMIPSYLSMTDLGKAELDAKFQHFRVKRPELGYAIDFLCLPDCGGSIGRAETRDLWNLIKDCKDTDSYGYIGENGKRATFQDFKAIVKDCVDNDMALRWF